MPRDAQKMEEKREREDKKGAHCLGLIYAGPLCPLNSRECKKRATRVYVCVCVYIAEPRALHRRLNI